MRRVHVTISGRVQGVFFRARTEQTAVSMNLKGWVRNLQNGAVEAVFEGKEENIERMLAWCREGPRLAKVEHVDVIDETYTGEFERFSIRYS
jgi:acylphosphatase